MWGFQEGTGDLRFNGLFLLGRIEVVFFCN